MIFLNGWPLILSYWSILSYFCVFSMVGVPRLPHICYNGYKEIELPTDLNIVTKHLDTVALDSMVKFEFWFIFFLTLVWILADMSMPLNDTDPNGESNAVLTPQVMLFTLGHILSVVSHETRLYRSLHICVSIYRFKLTETYHVFIFFNKSIKTQKIICESAHSFPFHICGDGAGRVRVSQCTHGGQRTV